MSVTANVPFTKRLRRIVRRHNRMVHGVSHVMQKDGLIVAKPRLYNPKFPFKGVILLIAVAFLFKGYVYADLGGRAYNERVATLSQGSFFEQSGAWMMHADPATVMVGDFLRNVLR